MEKINELLDVCKRVQLLDSVISLAPTNLKPTYINCMFLEFDNLENLIRDAEIELEPILNQESGSVLNMDVYRLKRELDLLKNELYLRYKNPIT